VNLDGPVRVAENVGVGSATVTLSFDAWKGATVASTTHTVAVLPAKKRPATESSAPNIAGTLVHPERSSSVTELQFSPDDKRLFVSGYPSGIVQIFDVAGMKQLTRIDTPPGLKGTSRYAILAPDWKTIYVPVEKRSVQTIERDGKRSHRINYSGEIRVFDALTGKEKNSVQPAKNSAPVGVQLSPDGRFLTYVERPSYDVADKSIKDQTITWNLGTGEKRKLADGYSRPLFLGDGKTVIIQDGDRQLEMRELDTLKTLAKLARPDKDRFFSLGDLSPDGTLVTVSLGGKKGAPLEFWFLDGRTLQPRGKLIGNGSPHDYGWGPGHFTPDSKRFIAIDRSEHVLVWNVAEQKIERRLPLGGPKTAWHLAISPNGKTAAIGWSPEHAADTEDSRDPDPEDYPQPRVSIIDLTGAVPPRVMLAPNHGWVGGLAFNRDGTTLALGTNGAIHLFDLSK
jgi:WD40 repeat protein